MGCKAKYVPIGANAFQKSIYLHHAARMNPEVTRESERVGCWSQAATSGQDKWQRGFCAIVIVETQDFAFLQLQLHKNIQNPAYRSAGQIFITPPPSPPL